MVKLMRIIFITLFRPFAGPKAVQGGSGRYTESGPEQHDYFN